MAHGNTETETTLMPSTNNKNDSPVATEDIIKEWWNYLTDHQTFSNALKRTIIKEYDTGSILRQTHPEFKSDSRPKYLRIAVCGLTSAGKSSMITTILTAVFGGSIQWWRSEFNQAASDQQRMVRQLGPETHLIEVATHNGERMFIELVDNRGLLNEANMGEALKVVAGDIPVNNRIERLGDIEYVSRFTSALEQKAERFHLAILVIPADLADDKIALYVNLRKLIRESTIPVLHVFTKADIEEADLKIAKLQDSLGLSVRDYLKMTCYNAHDPEAVADEDINSHALFVLLWAIIIADTKGIPINIDLNYKLKQTAQSVKNTAAVAKNYLGQESKLTLGLFVVIILLLFKLFFK